jgi:hypothetical protein
VTDSRTGRLAAAVGVILGAHLGMVVLGFLGALVSVPFIRQTGGGLDWLIGMFFGALLGMPLGGAMGCGLALRARNHVAAWRSARIAGLLLLVGLLPFGALWATGDREPGWSGWLFLIALEVPILAVAVMIRRVTGDRR